MDESQPEVSQAPQQRHRRPGQHGHQHAPLHHDRHGRGDPRRGAQPAGHRGPAPHSGGLQRHDHPGLQFDGLGRPGGERYQPRLRYGHRPCGAAHGRGPGLQQRDHLRGQAPRIRLTAPTLAGAFALALLLFFILILLTPSAAAQDNLTVRKVVFNATRVDFQSSEPHYGLQGYLTWLASEPNTTADWGYIVNPNFVSLGFVNIEQIPGRTNWLTFNNSVDPPGSIFIALEEENNTQRLAIGIGDGLSPGYSSCVITLQAIAKTYECGEPGFPTLDSLTVQTIEEYPPNMSFQLRHPWTTSDATLDGVVYEYQIFAGAIWTDLFVNSTTTEDGIVRAWFNTTDWEAGLISANTFRARARDQRTHEVSPWSCTVQARIGSLALGPYSCIGKTGFFLVDPSEDPSFPLINVPDVSSGLGLTKTQAALTLGLFFSIGLILFVSAFTGIVGAILVTPLMIGFLYTVNAIAAYVLTVVFIIAIGIIVLTTRRGEA